MSVQIHRVRFLNSQVSGVRALSFNHSQASNFPKKEDIKLAVGRGDGSIEIYNNSTWQCSSFFKPRVDQTVDGIAYLNNRLFTINGSDCILEHDFKTLDIKSVTRSDAGLIWSICANYSDNLIGICTEQGVISIFKLSENTELEPIIRIQSEVTSLVSMTFIDNNFVATGGTDGVIRVFNLELKSQVATMRIKVAKDEELVIWSLEYNPKFNQLVSTDSDGCISIWDLKNFTLLQNLRVHSGDALAVCFTNDYKCMRTSGLDQKICLLENALISQNKHKWTLMSSSVVHSSDVRCLASIRTNNGDIVASGGQDGVVGLHSNSNNGVRKIGLVSPDPPILASKNLVFEYEGNVVKGWGLNPMKLKYELTLNDDSFITAIAVDSEIGLLAVGTKSKLKVFLLDDDISLINEMDMSVKQLKFRDTEKLVIVNENNDVGEINTGDMSTANIGNGLLVDANLRYVVLITDGTLLTVHHADEAVRQAQAQAQNQTQTQDTEKETNSENTLPKLDSPIVAGVIMNNNLIVVTANKHIHEFSLETLQLTKWSRQSKQNSELIKEPDCPLGACVLNKNLLVYSPSYIFSVTLPENLSSGKLIKRYKPIAYLTTFQSALLVCERPVQQVRKLETNRKINL